LLTFLFFFLDDNSRISCNPPENRFKLFKEFEQGTVLPVYIKNMLLYSGYDIKFALQLLEMANFLKKPPLKSESLSLKKTDLPTKSSQGDEISEDSTSDNVIVETDTEKQQNLNVDLNSEEKKIKKNISYWFNKTSNTYKDNIVLKNIKDAKKKLDSLKIQWDQPPTANMFCVPNIGCLFCQATYRVRNRSSKEGSEPIWVLSNFYKHLKTHLQVGKKKQRGSSQQGTLNSFIH